MAAARDGQGGAAGSTELEADARRRGQRWQSAAAGSLLRCCEPAGRRLRVAVLLSGGVDSSVALRLLLAAGHSCVAFYLKIWFQVLRLTISKLHTVVTSMLGDAMRVRPTWVVSPRLTTLALAQEDFRNSWSACPWEEDLQYAQAVCDEVGVELRVVPLTHEYWDMVVTHSVAEIRAGRTPNPDMLCNSRIKFGAFYNAIDFSNFDRVASGHYARLERLPTADPSRLPSTGNEHVALLVSADEAKLVAFGRVRLFFAADLACPLNPTQHLIALLVPVQVKDQTYFLSHLTQEQLFRALFPLGHLPKAEVRRLADDMGLPNRGRKDSQGICFLGKVRFNEFVAAHLGEREGCILEAETGELLGTHRGYWFHTIGQRQGLGLSGGPWYVVAKSPDDNVVFVSRDYYSEDKARRVFIAGLFNWISGSPPPATARLLCKVRHSPRSYSCSLQFLDNAESDALMAGVQERSSSSEKAVVTLAEDDQGLAPGQFAAFYDGDICLGSGVILETGAPLEAATIPSPAAMQAARASTRSVVVGPRKSKVHQRERAAVAAAAGRLALSADAAAVC
eukprot:SM000081S22657  [mRNA]  locus=s81:333118:336706:- [translate_table: standard]